MSGKWSFVFVIAAILLSQPLSAQVDITMIDVNQGESILVTFPPRSDGTRKRMPPHLREDKLETSFGEAGHLWPRLCKKTTLPTATQ